MSVLIRRLPGLGARVGDDRMDACPHCPPRGRSHALARGLATGVWLVAVLIELGAVAVWLTLGGPRLPISFAGGPWGILTVAACAVATLSMGAFLARRMPGNLVGWVMMMSGLPLIPVLPANLMVWDALEVLRPVPGPTMAIAWLVSSMAAPVAIGSLTLVLLLFPDGRPSSRRWAVALLVPVAATTLLALGSALDRSLTWFPMLAGPVDPSVLGPGVARCARFLGFLGLVLSALLAAGSLVDRYRDAGETLRRQIRWVVLDGSLTALAVAPLLVGRYLLRPSEAVGELTVVVAALGAVTFPVTVAIAITRADLFDIDLVIGRTLVYLPLSAILAGMYAALVTFLQRVFVALTGGDSDAVIVLTTLILAAAVTPVRQTLDGLVERHFRAPRARRGQGAVAPAVEHAAAEPVPAGSSIDAGSLAVSPATHVERLEAIEARLLRLEHGRRLGRGLPVMRRSRRRMRRLAA